MHLFRNSRQIILDFVLNFISLPPCSIKSDVRWWWLWWGLYCSVLCPTVRYRLISAALRCQACHQEYTQGDISLLSIVSSRYSQLFQTGECRRSEFYLLMSLWDNIHQYELIQFPSKSLAVWTLNSLKEKSKTNRTSFPAQTSIRWWTEAGKSVLNKHNDWRNLSRTSQLDLVR